MVISKALLGAKKVIKTPNCYNTTAAKILAQTGDEKTFNYFWRHTNFSQVDSKKHPCFYCGIKLFHSCFFYFEIWINRLFVMWNTKKIIVFHYQWTLFWIEMENENSFQFTDSSWFSVHLQILRFSQSTLKISYWLDNG